MYSIEIIRNNTRTKIEKNNKTNARRSTEPSYKFRKRESTYTRPYFHTNIKEASSK